MVLSILYSMVSVCIFVFDGFATSWISWTKMTKVVSNRRQMEKLVSLMEGNPDIAKGICGKALSKKRWEKFAVELNSIGPPIRTCEKWIKVWADLKCKIKKKKTENKTEIQATGGGPNRLHTFSSLEESVVGILSMDSSIDPPGVEFGQEILSNADNEENNANSCNLLVEEEEGVETISPPRSPILRNAAKKTKKNKEVEEKILLLKQQTTSQEDFHNEIKKKISVLEELIRKVYYQNKDHQKELLKIKKEKFQLFKEEVRSRQSYRATNLRLTQQKLELKKRIVDMQLEETE